MLTHNFVIVNKPKYKFSIISNLAKRTRTCKTKLMIWFDTPFLNREKVWVLGKDTSQMAIFQ